MKNKRLSSAGEIKPFAYALRRLILERIFRVQPQKRLKSKTPFDPDEPPEIPREAEQIALAAYHSFELPDNERVIVMASYCKNCKNKAIRVFSTKTRKLICIGCGKELAEDEMQCY